MFKPTLTAIVLAVAVVNPVHADPSLFEQGRQDRAAWEQWFNGLQGDYKTGAFFWSSQRSLSNPGSCKQVDDDFYAGCTAAKTRLSASDTRRKTEPDYKAGWNAYNTPAAAPATTPPSAASPPAPGRQVAAGPGWSVTVNGGNVAEASGSQAAAVSLPGPLTPLSLTEPASRFDPASWCLTVPILSHQGENPRTLRRYIHDRAWIRQRLGNRKLQPHSRR